MEFVEKYSSFLWKNKKWITSLNHSVYGTGRSKILKGE